MMMRWEPGGFGMGRSIIQRGGAAAEKDLLLADLRQRLGGLEGGGGQRGGKGPGCSGLCR